MHKTANFHPNLSVSWELAIHAFIMICVIEGNSPDFFYLVSFDLMNFWFCALILFFPILFMFFESL